LCRCSRKGNRKDRFHQHGGCLRVCPPGTNEQGAINPFNEYGRTKYEAECVYRDWQAQDPGNRALVIIRPTVVFGEQNRGNVYNLLRYLADGRFVMVGSGRNVKSMAYVENIAAFLEHSLSFGPGSMFTITSTNQILT
jgi:GlcNAc-P-P-Und epimerase